MNSERATEEHRLMEKQIEIKIHPHDAHCPLAGHIFYAASGVFISSCLFSRKLQITSSFVGQKMRNISHVKCEMLQYHQNGNQYSATKYASVSFLYTLRCWVHSPLTNWLHFFFFHSMHTFVRSAVVCISNKYQFRTICCVGFALIVWNEISIRKKMRLIVEWWWNDECDNGGGSIHFWHSLIEQLLGSDHGSFDAGIFFPLAARQMTGAVTFPSISKQRPHIFRLISWSSPSLVVANGMPSMPNWLIMMWSLWN